MKKKGFTLTELMVALAIVGILCAILLPVVHNILPNQNTVMAKRTYYTVQQVVSDLINDDSCYPDMSMGNPPVVGFNYLGADDNCIGYTSEDTNSELKFLKLFSNRLDGTLDTSSTPNTLTTKDGVKWYFCSQDFASTGDTDSHQTIAIDVNGDDKPNCAQDPPDCNNVIAKCAEDRTGGFDQYTVDIYADGRLEIRDTWAKDAININKDLNDE